jgi:hypothetical protein
MMSIAERARWAGLETGHRDWLLDAQCTAERFLALVRAGLPGDVAYARACSAAHTSGGASVAATAEGLLPWSSSLMRHWGHSVWKTESAALGDAAFAAAGASKGAIAYVAHFRLQPLPQKSLSPAAQLLIGLGDSIRRAVQVSLMEGSPCTPRVEAALTALSSDLKAAMEREVAVLPSKCLLPLFLLVAPALLGMMAAGFAIAWSSAGISDFGGMP